MSDGLLAACGSAEVSGAVSLKGVIMVNEKCESNAILPEINDSASDLCGGVAVALTHGSIMFSAFLRHQDHKLMLVKQREGNDMSSSSLGMKQHEGNDMSSSSLGSPPHITVVFLRQQLSSESPSGTGIEQLAEPHGTLPTVMPSLSVKLSSELPGKDLMNGKSDTVDGNETVATLPEKLDDSSAFRKTRSPLLLPLVSHDNDHHCSIQPMETQLECGVSTTPVNRTSTLTTNTMVTKWIKPQPVVTGPYQCWG
jgi:hypothetical protein